MSVLRAAVVAGAAGVVATPLPAVAGLGGSQGSSINAFDAIVYAVDWANVALFGTDVQLTGARTFVINAAAWAAIGGVTALAIRSCAAQNSRRRPV